jgi:hypothetical protein
MVHGGLRIAISKHQAILVDHADNLTVLKARIEAKQISICMDTQKQLSVLIKLHHLPAVARGSSFQAWLQSDTERARD